MKKLLCVIGPSGSGKSTYVNYVREKKGYGEIIATTTRLPRVGEVDGKDYHFVSDDEFLSIEMIQKDEYAGHYYGTAQKDLDDAFKKSDCAFMVVTYEGAMDFQQLFHRKHLDIQVITLFVYTPIDILKQRMIHRGDDIEKINERIVNIEKRKEYENMNKTDYVFHVNTSLSLEECCQEFLQLVESIA